MIEIETGIRIERPIDGVFDYLSDPRHFPAWNSAVQSVRQTSVGPSGEAGATYAVERQLPSGHAVNELEIVTSRRPSELVMHTTSGPAPFRYRFQLAPDGGATDVRVEVQADLGAAGRLLRPVMSSLVRKGIDGNLEALAAILDR
jgi:uncharacterized protein YndB with AHSA1/START domain